MLTTPALLLGLAQHCLPPTGADTLPAGKWQDILRHCGADPHASTGTPALHALLCRSLAVARALQIDERPLLASMLIPRCRLLRSLLARSLEYYLPWARAHSARALILAPGAHQANIAAINREAAKVARVLNIAPSWAEN
jgi:hypothetical protein